MLRHLLAALTVAILPQVATADMPSRLDAVIDRAVAEEKIVGAVVLVGRDGKIVYRRAAGFADREARRPTSEDTVFRLASVTKPIVSVAALRLVDQGVITLDDAASKWIPGFRPKLADGREPKITIRQLLNHTAGLGYGFSEKPDGPYHRAGVSDGLDEPGRSMDDNLRRIASVPLLHEPGTQWDYSVATDVLGEVIARATGSSLPAAIEKLVTGPLGMSATGFSPPSDPSRLATPYADGAPRAVRMSDPHVVPNGAAGIRYSPSRVFEPTSFASGGAGMVGVAGDVFTFLETIRTGGGAILKPETARLISTDSLGTASAGWLSPGWKFGLGASVLVDPKPTNTPQAAGTFQWGGAWGHSWFVDPENRLTVIVFTNTAIAGMVGPFPDAIRDAVYER